MRDDLVCECSGLNGIRLRFPHVNVYGLPHHVILYEPSCMHNDGDVMRLFHHGLSANEHSQCILELVEFLAT